MHRSHMCSASIYPPPPSTPPPPPHPPPPRKSVVCKGACVIYICIYTCMHTCIHTYIYAYIHTYIFVVVNFDALAQASDFPNRKETSCLPLLNAGFEPKPNFQQTECLLTNRLSYRGSSWKLELNSPSLCWLAFAPDSCDIHVCCFLFRCSGHTLTHTNTHHTHRQTQRHTHRHTDTHRDAHTRTYISPSEYACIYI